MYSNVNVSNPLSMHDVRRLAPAALDVMQRNADKSVIAAHAATMVPVANGVLIAIQVIDRLKGKQVALLAESTEQTAQLHGLMLGWSPLLERDLASFDIGAYVRDPNLPFDVVQKAMSLKSYVEQEAAGLPYQQTLLAELTARIEGADGAAKSAYTARTALQEKQREVRELSATFHKGLVSLRKTVRAMLGSSHLDYQRLRVPSRAAAEPPDDEAPVTVPSATETAAASTAPNDSDS
jgi:hypothetical protein